jgi:DNA polymerase epsilon subunit 4
MLEFQYHPPLCTLYIIIMQVEYEETPATFSTSELLGAQVQAQAEEGGSDEEDQDQDDEPEEEEEEEEEEEQIGKLAEHIPH